jgi:hypothetical protein
MLPGPHGLSVKETDLVDLNNEPNGTRPDALSKLSRRADDLRAALREMQSRKRNQEKADRERLEALVGFALLADIEADKASGGGRRAYISEVLDRLITSGPSRAFLATKGWL